MNKHILSTLLFAGACGLTAQVPFGNVRVAPPSGPAVKSSFHITTDGAAAGSGASSGIANKNQEYLLRRGIVPYSFVEIGNTWYDLQSNASVGNRVLLYPDGTVSATWTTSADEGSTTFPNRGSGYNHYNKTTWGAVKADRIETTRLGWPSIGVLSNGSEWIMAHDAALGGFVLSKNGGKGQTNWTPTAVLKENNLRPLWGRAVSSGNYIHAIYTYADSSQPGEPRAPTRNGVLAPMVYSRSSNGGVTWDKQAVMLPGNDTSRITNGGGDQYAIACRDSIVAIIFGGLADDVSVWKSTNNGSTWTKMIADSFKYAPYKSTKLMLDTPFTNDGTVQVLIDRNGKVHAFWGGSRMLDDDNTDQSFSFFPGYQYMGYWNEITKKSQIIAGGAAFDRDGNGVNSLSSATTSFLSNGQVPTNLNTVARLGNTSALRQPSPAIDAQGNIYVTFSVPIEGDVSDLDANYRDIGIVYSTDGGATWKNEQNLTQTMMVEDDFASVAPDADNFVHMVWQRDLIPGTNLQNNSTSANNHEPVKNQIMYAAIPTAKILADAIGHQWGLGIHKANQPAEVFVVSQNFPNPFSDKSEVLIFMDEPGTLQVDILTLDGKTIRSSSEKLMTRGNHNIQLDGKGLKAGMYLYRFTAGKNVVTKKMTIQ
ncbi:MAG: T9SS type A sorting domain-containing protein [Bacteroidetes bacterium]|nr:T9SS type A sorting domain-containing protein [Bacteroidota bacterium]